MYLCKNVKVQLYFMSILDNNSIYNLLCLLLARYRGNLIKKFLRKINENNARGGNIRGLEL